VDIILLLSLASGFRAQREYKHTIRVIDTCKEEKEECLPGFRFTAVLFFNYYFKGSGIQYGFEVSKLTYCHTLISFYVVTELANATYLFIGQ